MPHTTARSQWRTWLARGAKVALVLTVVFATAALPVWLHTREVRKAENESAQLEARNALWTQVASGDPSEGVVGQLARELHPKVTAQNPAKELLAAYVEPGAYPGIEEVLGIEVYDNETEQNGRSSSTLDQGYLAPEFVVRAVQATPENVKDVLEEVPTNLPEDGIRSWRNYGLLVAAPTALLAALTLLAAVVSVPVRPVLAHRRRRAERRRFAALPPLAQDVLLLQKRLASYPADDPQVAQVRLQAQRTYQRVTDGAVDAQTRTGLEADVSAMEAELEDIEAANQAGLDAYRGFTT